MIAICSSNPSMWNVDIMLWLIKCFAHTTIANWSLVYPHPVTSQHWRFTRIYLIGRMKNKILSALIIIITPQSAIIIYLNKYRKASVGTWDNGHGSPRLFCCTFNTTKRQRPAVLPNEKSPFDDYQFLVFKNMNFLLEIYMYIVYKICAAGGAGTGTSGVTVKTSHFVNRFWTHNFSNCASACQINCFESFFVSSSSFAKAMC